jgi:periplasmic divalent cation tolerance protein
MRPKLEKRHRASFWQAKFFSIETPNYCSVSASEVNGLQNSYVIVLVTTASKQEAEKIAQHLLKQRLIACANIVGPVSSLFRWSGKVENAEEYLIFMKSRRDLFDKLAETVQALHSYEVPEILVLPIVGGLKEYLAWLGSCLE